MLSIPIVIRCYHSNRLFSVCCITFSLKKQTKQRNLNYFQGNFLIKLRPESELNSMSYTWWSPTESCCQLIYAHKNLGMGKYYCEMYEMYKNHLQVGYCCKLKENNFARYFKQDMNLEPIDHEMNALSTELSFQMTSSEIYGYFSCLSTNVHVILIQMFRPMENTSRF